MFEFTNEILKHKFVKLHTIDKIEKFRFRKKV